MTDDLRNWLAVALNDLPESFWLDGEDVPTVLDKLLPVVESYGRASAATALRQAADAVTAWGRDGIRNAVRELRDRADALEADR